jgi:hypothetical protein
VSTLIEQAQTRKAKDQDEADNKFVNINKLIDPRLKLTSTQLGLQRLKGKSDLYPLSTLPPRLYQSNPFAQQTKPTKTGEILYKLTTQEVLATAKEIQDVQDAKANKETLSQAVETLIATTARTRARRKRKASSKATNNTELEALKKGKRGGRGD